MKKRKLGIIGGSGLYKMDGFEKTRWKKIKTGWGNPSDEILIAKLGKEEICFIPRHGRGHKINPSNINFRANIDAMKQMGVTDIISVSAVGSLKENLTIMQYNGSNLHSILTKINQNHHFEPL